jgi:hypothetical protein
LSYFSQSLVELKRLFCFETSQRRAWNPFSWNENKSFVMLVGIMFHLCIFLALLFFFIWYTLRATNPWYREIQEKCFLCQN